MAFDLVASDPFRILASTKAVLDHATFVRVNERAVIEHAPRIGAYLKDHADFPDHGHRLTGDPRTDARLIFFESMLAFCFWSFPWEPKWGIVLSNGEKVDGWYGVCAAFQRAHKEGIPVADGRFLATVTADDVRRIFRSATGAEIPLLDQRVAILNENARVLTERFGGEVTHLLAAADYDAVKLLRLLIEHFPSYRDIAPYRGHDVVFLKIAHLFALDLEYRLTPQANRPFLKNLDQLSVFADYKLPQLLRMFGILEYAPALAEKVDMYAEIPAGSAEEVEIRAGAIWGVELLRQRVPDYSSIQIGHVIWLASQDPALQERTKPYHRTFTTFY